MESDEVIQPVSGDRATGLGDVTIEYAPDQACIESKSLKLYLWSFREEGVFCEALAAQIANDVRRLSALLGEGDGNPETAGGNKTSGHRPVDRD